MSGLIDLTGNRYGRLVVLERSQRGSKAKWSCLCDCGVTKDIDRQHLRDGRTKSCGCLASEKTKERQTLPLGEAARRALLYEYKRNAMQRGLLWDITEDEFTRITSGDCYWCGCSPSRKHFPNGVNGPYVFNGIDRLNNSIGYLRENIVSCCTRCNFAKKAHSAQDFLGWIRAVYERHHD